jgi:hypothetical protein
MLLIGSLQTFKRLKFFLGIPCKHVVRQYDGENFSVDAQGTCFVHGLGANGAMWIWLG